MRSLACAAIGAIVLFASGHALAQTTLTIATVNNGDMIRMQGLTREFTAKNPGIAVKWVTLEENVLRQRVTTDIATKGGQFDVLTIGTYEVPIWGKQGWLLPLEKLGAGYDVNDLLAPIRAGLSINGKLYDDISQGLVREGRAEHASQSDVGFHRQRSQEDHRPLHRDLRRLPAGKARLGREHCSSHGHC